MVNFYRTLSGVLALMLVLSGCTVQKNNESTEVTTSPTEPSVLVGEQVNNSFSPKHDELLAMVSSISFDDIVESLGEHSFLDDYLKSSEYESLVSDFAGFRDCGDIEAARNVLLELGKHVLRGSVLDVLYREDSEFAERIGVDFDEEDIDISYGWNAECVRGVDVVINGGDKYKEFVQNGQFGVRYSVCSYGTDFIDLLDDLDNGNIDDVYGLQDAFNSIKKFIVLSGNYAGDTETVMDGLNYYGGIVNNGEIEYTENSEVVAVLKKS